MGGGGGRLSAPPISPFFGLLNSLNSLKRGLLRANHWYRGRGLGQKMCDSGSQDPNFLLECDRGLQMCYRGVAGVLQVGYRNVMGLFSGMLNGCYRRATWLLHMVFFPF